MTYFIVFLSGILTALPLMDDGLAFLSWISIVPLLVIARKKESAYRHGLVFSLGYYGVMYYWFTYLYPLDFAGFSNGWSIAIVAAAWIGLSVLQGTGMAFVPFLYRRLQTGHELLAPVTAASLWCVMEWLQSLFWFGMPWGRLAVTQHTVQPVIQSASLFGSLFISFLIVLVNGYLAIAYIKFRETKRIPISAFIAAGLASVNLIYGFIAVAAYKDAGDPIKVACIQGNIASGDKWADNSLATSLSVYSDLSLQAAEETGAQIIVWPETVITISLNRNITIANNIRELARESRAYIVVCAFYSEYDAEEDYDKTYNAMYVCDPNGVINQTVYKKRHLVPFGEFLPMPGVLKTIVPILNDINMFDDDIYQGEKSEIFHTALGNIGGLVCFDSIYESLTLASVRDGAELIALGTNDSWFSDSAAVYQHNGHAVLRAVESGRYIMRAANTGISSVISPTGEIKSELLPLVRGYTYSTVCFSSSRTVYSYVGNLIVWLSIAFILFDASYIIFKKCQEKPKKSLDK